MSQLRRMLLSNVGYRSAYYSGMLLNFCNDKTNKPENTVIWLANQGGKTTLISLLFTNIEPNKNRFVQHLQKKDHYFADYFYTTPGVVALELQIGEADLIGVTPSLIIGQCVVVQDNRSGETQRVFFGFYANEKITLDHLPFKGTGNNGNIQSMSAFKVWLEEMREQNSTIYSTESQYDWKVWLESKGVERELLAKQVDFCRSEGGISDFASFKNEYTFLEQFFRLALDEKLSFEAHEMLKSAYNQYKDMPILKQQKIVYEKLLKGFEWIKPKASQYLQYSQNIKDRDDQLTLLVKKIRLRKRWLFNEVSVLDKSCKKENIAISNSNKIVASIEVCITHIDLMIHNMKCIEADVLLSAEKNRWEEARKKLIMINAIGAYEILEKVITDVEILQRTINTANHDIKPIENKLKKTGSQLIAIYELKIKNFRENYNSIESKITKNKEYVSQCEKEINKCRQEKKKEESTISKASQWFESYHEHYRYLKNKGHIVVFDDQLLSIYEIKSYWSREYTQQAEKLEELHILKMNKEREVEKLKSKRIVLTSDIAVLDAELKRHEKDKSKAVAEKKQLESKPQLCKLIQMSQVNPDDKALLVKIDQFIDGLEQKIAKNKGHIEELQIQKQWLEEDRLQKPDYNIQHALDWLEKKEIKATYYPHYLGRQQLSAIETKRLVESDPARFYGIQVNNLAVVQNCLSEINREKLGLSQPVVISEGCNEIDQQHGYLVLPVRNDAAYNEQAAKYLLNSINKKLKKLDAQQVDDQYQCDDLKSAQEQLKFYQACYGSEWFEEQSEKIDRKNNSQIGKRIEQDDIKNEIKHLNNLFVELENKLESTKNSKFELKTHQSAVIDFINNFESKKIGKQDEDNKAKASIDRLKKYIKKESVSIKTLNITLKNNIDERKYYEKQIEVNNDMLAKISYSDESTMYSIVDVSDLLKLQSEYDSNVKFYNTLMNESNLYGLNGELKVLISNREKKKQEFLINKEGLMEEAIKAEYHLIQRNNHSISYIKKQQQENIDNHLLTIGGYEVEYKNSKKIFDKLKHNISDVIVLEEEITRLELSSLMQSKKNKKEEIRKEIHLLKEEEKIIAGKLQMYDSERKIINSGLKQLSNNLLIKSDEYELCSLADAEVINMSSEETLDDIFQLLQVRLAVSKKRDNTKVEVVNYFRKNILSIVQNSEQAAVIGAQVTDIKRFSDDQLMTDSERHILSMQENVNTTESKIQHHEGTLKLVYSSFDRLLDEADATLYAAFKVHIPDDMLHYSGKVILKSRLSAKDKLQTRLSVKQRKILYSRHLHNMFDKHLVDEDGYKLAASFILAAYEIILSEKKIRKNKKKSDILNIRIIKPHDIEVEYIPVHKMVGSGGEGLTAGLLLYLVIANIRGERMGQGGTRVKGSFLLLDNPFSRANKIDLIRPQTQLAKKLNIQLIFATGIEDLNAIAEFEHIIRLRKERMDIHSKRQYIEHEMSAEHNSDKDLEDLDRYRIQSVDYSFSAVNHEA